MPRAGVMSSSERRPRWLRPVRGGVASRCPSRCPRGGVGASSAARRGRLIPPRPSSPSRDSGSERSGIVQDRTRCNVRRRGVLLPSLSDRHDRRLLRSLCGVSERIGRGVPFRGSGGRGRGVRTEDERDAERRRAQRRLTSIGGWSIAADSTAGLLPTASTHTETRMRSPPMKSVIVGSSSNTTMPPTTPKIGTQ